VNGHSDLSDTSHGVVAAVVTRPPEIIALLKIPCEDTNVFVVFDSHPRESHPQGAAFIINASIDATANYLDDLLKFDMQIIEDKSLQWQAQLLANFSAHIYTPKNQLSDPDKQSDVVLESSLAVLALKAEVARLEARAKALESENQRLKRNNNELEDRYVPI
jgi:hypothetical protein